jgi:2-haloacid dehalogenase
VPGKPRVTTLVFDILGTVVNQTGSMVTEFGNALGVDDAESRALTDEWSRRISDRHDEITAGRADWESEDTLSRMVLDDLAQAHDLSLDRATLDGLAQAGHRLRAWPDSMPALDALSGTYTLVALSNADMSALTDMSYRNSLRWHCVLSGELVRCYKPDAVMYRMALDLLRLDPAETMMVAAYAWDLRAAAGQGMRTAYVGRPGGDAPGPQDRFDVQVDSLTDLPRRIETEILAV